MTIPPRNTSQPQTAPAKPTRNKRRLPTLLTILLLTACPPAKAATLNVPADYPTIQSAIDAATTGDIVEIADGTYTGPGNRSLDINSKILIVRSASGNPHQCTIDCQRQARAFHIHGGEDTHVTLQALTIINGFTNEHPASDVGGGIRCGELTSLMIQNCVVSHCFSGIGGGVYCEDDSRVSMANCTFLHNSTFMWGGAICCESSIAATIFDCEILDNMAGEGGGICCASGTTVHNTRIIGNRAELNGAGLYCIGAPYVANCEIRGNCSTNLGGGIYCKGDPVFTNCTITNNSVFTYSPGGVYCSEGSPVFTNCIFWNNSPNDLDVNSDSLVLSYCNIPGGWPGVGNISDDPMLSFPHDPRLTVNSPCIDAGTNSLLVELLGSDLDGNDRLQDGDADGTVVVDIGAYEFRYNSPCISLSDNHLRFTVAHGESNELQHKLLLQNTGTGAVNWEAHNVPDWLTVSPPSGTSNDQTTELTIQAIANMPQPGSRTAVLEIADPSATNSPRKITVTLTEGRTLHVPSQYPTIQEAIDNAAVGDYVSIADGTYTGPGNTRLIYTGKSITVRSASGNPANCIIDCQGTSHGVSFYFGEWPDAVLSGLTVMNAGDTGFSGGAIQCSNYSNPTIRNCIVRDCEFERGGGIYISHAAPTILDTLITNVVATGYGGGVFCYSGAPTLTNCSISGNSSAEFGAGVLVTQYSAASLINCTITGNIANGPGGGLYKGRASSVFLRNCTIAGNSSAGSGGGIMFQPIGSTTISNCIIWGNTPQAISASEEPSVSFSNIQGGWPGIGNIDADPLFIDTNGPDDDPTTWHDNDYRLSPGSPCIDSGSNGALPLDSSDLDNDGNTTELTPLDLDGRPRFLDDPQTPDTGQPLLPTYPYVVDMGAYEYRPQKPADLNHDGTVDDADFAIFLLAFGSSTGHSSYNPDCDYDNDGMITFVDYQLWLQHYRSDTNNPTATAPTGTPGDFDADQDIDLADFAILQTCFPDSPQTSFPCRLKFDFNNDHQVDLQDLSLFQEEMEGP